MRFNSLPSLLLAFGLSLAAIGASAQLADPDPDWKEVEVPPPPAFRTDKLIFLEMPRHMSIKVGVDPDTLKVTGDGIVRYVVVASSPGGNVNASYEGIRCLTGEVKIYARHSASAQWKPVTDAQWKPLNANQPSLHALALARQGACDGRAVATHSTEEMVRRLTTQSLESTRQ